MRSQRRLVSPQTQILQDAFLTTWDTRIVSAGSTASNQVLFPVRSYTGVVYDCVIDWGDGTSNTMWQAFNEAQTLHTYAVEGIYQIKVTGIFPQLYTYNASDKLKLISIDNWGSDPTIEWGSVHEKDFYGFPLTVYPSGGDIFSKVTDGNAMFWVSGLTTLHEDAIFENMTLAYGTFRATAISSLPSNMNLSKLTDGRLTFYACSNLVSLPNGLLLSELTNGSNMFQGTKIPTIPNGVTLNKLENGYRMFYGITQLTSAANIDLASLTAGVQMFYNVTLNTVDYSNLLIRTEASNPNNNVDFHGGNSKYNSSASSARASLVSRGWTIADGGLI